MIVRVGAPSRVGRRPPCLACPNTAVPLPRSDPPPHPGQSDADRRRGATVGRATPTATESVLTRPFRFLVAESAPPEARGERRDSVGRSAGESYAVTLRALAPGAVCEIVLPAEEGDPRRAPDGPAGYDAVFLSGSPLHLYEDTPEVRRQVEFMRAVFASGTPAFGSCAGLHVAAVAAGGTVRVNRSGHESGFARRVTATPAGRDHPLLAGRPPAFDAPTLHADEVETLPDGALLLATNGATWVQAAEIRHGAGVFWGVQYHPELSLGEVAGALRRQAGELVEQGLVPDRAVAEDHAGLIEALGREPGRRDLAWRLGLDAEVTEDARRRRELRNFIDHLAGPARSARGRG